MNTEKMFTRTRDVTHKDIYLPRD